MSLTHRILLLVLIPFSLTLSAQTEKPKALKPYYHAVGGGPVFGMSFFGFFSSRPWQGLELSYMRRSFKTFSGHLGVNAGGMAGGSPNQEFYYLNADLGFNIQLAVFHLRYKFTPGVSLQSGKVSPLLAFGGTMGLNFWRIESSTGADILSGENKLMMRVKFQLAYIFSRSDKFLPK